MGQCHITHYMLQVTCYMLHITYYILHILQCQKSGHVCMQLSSVRAACRREQTSAFQLPLAPLLVLLWLTQCLAQGKNSGVHSLFDAAFAHLTWEAA